MGGALWQNGSWIVLCIWMLLIMYSASYVNSFPKRIPIGIIFDNSSVLFRTAFKYESLKHNADTSSSFRLDLRQKIVDETDSFDVLQSMCATISKGTFALLGVIHRSTFNSVDAFCRTFHMPYITISAPIYESLNASAGPPGHTSDFPHTDSASLSSNGRGYPGGPERPGYVSSGGPDSPQESYLVYMRPSYDRALIDVIKYYQWPKIFYVYNSNEGLVRLEKLYHVINEEELKLEISPVRLMDVHFSYLILRQIDAQKTLNGFKHIVLDLTTLEIQQSLLKQIQGVGMNRAGYHYLVGGLGMDELNISEFKHGGVNITGFSLIDRSSHRVQALQKEWDRLNSTIFPGAGNNSKFQLEAALAMDAVTLLNLGLTTLLRSSNQDIFNFRRGQVYNNDGSPGIECRKDPPVPWIHGPVILDSFKKIRFHGTTGNVAFDNEGHRKDFTLSVLELNLDSDVQQIGTWEYNKGLTITRQVQTDQEVALPPVNRTRIITSIISRPYLDFKKKSQDDKKSGLTPGELFEGYCVDMAREIAKLVKFEYVIRIVGDGKYGEKTPDGTWNGMVGELTRKEADLAIAPLTITSIRERVIDFSKPFMNLGISIMIKKPEKQKPGVFSFMDPLASTIWGCIVISYLGVSFVLFLVSRFSPYEWQIEDRESGPSFANDFTILNSLWFSLGAFMRQGIDISPRSLSGRIVGSAWWFFTLIIISSYTANLAAFLTVERMLTPIENADDLSKQREIHYGTLSSGSTMDFFKHSNIPTYERMWAFMRDNPGVFTSTTEEGVQRVRQSKGKYAFLLESTMNDYYNQRKDCNTMKVGGNLDSKGYGVATPIGSDLREKVGLAVLQLLESGELQKLHKTWWYDKGECVVEDSKGGGSSQSALTLSNVAGIFYILIAGLGLSMLMSLLEFLYKSRKQVLRQKKTYSESSTKARLSLSAGSMGSERENGGYCYNGPSEKKTYRIPGSDKDAKCGDRKNSHTQV